MGEATSNMENTTDLAEERTVVAMNRAAQSWEGEVCFLVMKSNRANKLVGQKFCWELVTLDRKNTTQVIDSSIVSRQLNW